MTSGGRVPLLVWDFDGTLADSFGLIRASATAALAAHGRPAPDEDRLRALVGLSLETTFRRLLAEPAAPEAPDDRLVTSLVASYRATAARLGTTDVTLYPGIALLLGELAAAGAVSAIATSKSRAGVAPLLDGLGVARHFAAVITHDDVAEGRGKPDPQMVVLACRAVGTGPGDAVVIGDTAFDIGMGHAAGARTAGVCWGNGARADLAAAGPTWLVDDVDGLRSALLDVVTREGGPNTRQ